MRSAFEVRKRHVAIGSLRRLTRFSLHRLLFFVTLCALGFAWCGANARQRNVEKRAIAEIERICEAGPLARVGSWETCFETVGNYEVRPSAPQWLARPLALCGWDVADRVVELHLVGGGVDDRIVEHLSVFTALKRLSLRQTRVSDEGLRRLERALPQVAIEFVDIRDLEIRSPVPGTIVYVEEDGAAVKRGETLMTLALDASEPEKHYSIRAPQDGTLRYPVRYHANAIRIGTGEAVRERQLLLIIQPFDSLTSI